MEKIRQTISIVILILSLTVAPALAEATMPPTEVERVKDYYYFKIHGGPQTPITVYPYGKAEFIYKNLSTDPQDVLIEIEGTWLDKYSFADFKWLGLEPGEEWSSYAAEDYGVTVYFKLYIDDSLAFSGTIWVPPPQSS